MFDKAGDIHFDLPPSLGLEDAVQKVPDAKLVYMKAEGVYTKIVKRARAEKFREEKHKLDVISLGKKEESLLERAQPDKVLEELVKLAIDRRLKNNDLTMDPIETPSSPQCDERW